MRNLSRRVGHIISVNLLKQFIRIIQSIRGDTELCRLSKRVQAHKCASSAFNKHQPTVNGADIPGAAECGLEWRQMNIKFRTLTMRTNSGLPYQKIPGL